MPRVKQMWTVYLNAEQDQRLRALADRTGFPMAGYIRDGVDLVLEREEGRLRVQDAAAAAKGAAANDLDQVLGAAAVAAQGRRP